MKKTNFIYFLDSFKSVFGNINPTVNYVEFSPPLPPTPPILSGYTGQQFVSHEIVVAFSHTYSI